MVLLNNGAVSTSADCCCGGCVNCIPTPFPYTPPQCVDDDGNCWSGDRCSSDVPCQGEQVPCNLLFLTDNAYCCNLDGSIGRLCSVSTVNPDTCEQDTVIIGDGCACDKPGERGDGTHQAVDQWTPCTNCTGLDCGACCFGDACYTLNATECFNFGGIFHLGFSCSGLYCPI